MADIGGALSESAGLSGVEAAAGGAVLTAFELMTADDEGWPHVAWLGPAEIVPLNNVRIALAIWPSSTTKRNLEGGRAVLQIVANGSVQRWRLLVESLGPFPVNGGELAAFRAVVDRVVEDQVGYAQVLSGPTYRLDDPARTIERWRRQASALLQVAKSA